jgi:hypothetical protein
MALAKSSFAIAASSDLNASIESAGRGRNRLCLQFFERPQARLTYRIDEMDVFIEQHSGLLTAVNNG